MRVFATTFFKNRKIPSRTPKLPKSLPEKDLYEQEEANVV
jgi:hypothetical protein